MFGEANPHLCGMFLFGHYLQSYFEKRGQNGSHKLDQADLNSPRQDLSNDGLGIVVALLVRWQINFVCVSTWGPIQL